MTSRKRPRPFGSKKPRPTIVVRSHLRQSGVKPALDEISSMERRLFGYFVSYALLLVFVVVTALSTTELQLLIPKRGINLPFLGISTSIRGFFIVSTIIVCAASLFMAREFWALEALRRRKKRQTSYIFARSGGDAEERPLFGVEGDIDRIALNMVSDFVFFVSGPATIVLLAFWFADEQDRVVFALQTVLFVISCYFSWIFYRRTVKTGRRRRYRGFWRTWMGIKYAGMAIIALKFLVCVDVIYLPTTISPTFFLREHTSLLDTSDGGVPAFVPHIRIDRFTNIWNGETPKQLERLAFENGSPNADYYFMSRAVGIDLRHRQLRFLDLQFQIAPRLMVHYSDLSGANLSASRLMGSNFVGTKMYDVNMQFSVLDGSRFNDVDVKFGIWQDVNARGVVFDNTDFDSSAFVHANFLGSSFFGVNITNSFLSGAIFSAASFYQATFKNNKFDPKERFSVFISDKNSRNNIDDFDKYFDESDSDAISKLVDGFCTGLGKAADANALYTISTFYRLEFPERIHKISKAFEKSNCKSASTAWSIDTGQ